MSSTKTDITVARLVDLIKTGELSLPEMQRGYVWKADRVRDLLDSLYRGYPSGTILVWETDRSVPSREAAIGQEESPYKGHKLLLDGQQRLTSLSSILRGEPVRVHGRPKPIDILFNLDHPEGGPTDEPEDDDEEEDDDVVDDDDDESAGATRAKSLAFAKASQALLASPTWIRVTDIFSDKSDAELLQRALPGGWADPNFKRYSERVQRVRKIRDYSYVMQVLDRGMSYEEVAEIFVRVNSRGVKLRGSDLALAQITSRWRDSLRLFEEFREACEANGFPLDIGVIVRSLVVFSTGQSRFKTVGSLTRDKLEAAWPATKTNVLWALNYLRGLGVHGPGLLSSLFIIIALAYHHERHPILKGDEGRQLRRWVMYANARGHYSRGSTETVLDADLAMMREGKGASELLDAIQRQVGRLQYAAHDLIGSSPKSPILPLMFLALASRGGIDLGTGEPLRALGGKLENWHYVFSDKQLAAVGVARSERRELSNVVFTNAARRGAKGVAGTAERWATKALKNHGDVEFAKLLLPSDTEFYKPESYSLFLEFRRQALAELLNEFIDGVTSVDVSAEQLKLLIGGGESDTVEFKQRALDDQGKVLDYIPKEVASLLNARGGYVLIGVEDGGAIMGIEADMARIKSSAPSLDQYQRMLTERIAGSIGKQHMLGVKVSTQTIDGHLVAVIGVKSGFTSVYVKGPNDTAKFYVRTGSMCQELVGHEAESYIKTRWKTVAH